MNFGYSVSFKTLDKGLIEQLGPTGMASTIFNVSFNTIGLNTGFIYHTIFLLVYGFTFSFFFYILILFDLINSAYNVKLFLTLFCYLLLCLS